MEDLNEIRAGDIADIVHETDRVLLRYLRYQRISQIKVRNKATCIFKYMNAFSVQN